MDFCLLAISGDCAAGGMSENSDFIPLKEFPKLLRSYLRNQLEMEIEGQLMEYSISQKFTDLCREHHALGNALIDCGIFQHKWHKRTDWIICELHEGQPLNQKGPFNRCSIEGAE